MGAKGTLIPSRSRRFSLGYALLFVFLAYCSFLPVLAVAARGIGAAAHKDAAFAATLAERFSGSVFMAVSVAIASTALGLALSLALWRIRFRGRPLLRALALLPLASPPLVGTISYVMLFGKRGLLTHAILGLEVSAYGWHGVFIMQTASLTALAYLILQSAARKTDVSVEEAARTLGATEGRIFLRVTLPAMLPELSASLLLAFLASMADFGTPVIIGGRFQTLASELYLQITGLYDLQTASLYALALLIPCLLAFFLQTLVASRMPNGAAYALAKDISMPRLPRSAKAFLIAIATAYCVLQASHFVFVAVGAFTERWGRDFTPTLRHVKSAFSGDLSPFVNTFSLAVVSAGLASILGVALAYRTASRKTPATRLAELFAVLPAAVPGILFGIGYLIVFRHPLFGIGKWIPAPGTPPILLGTGAIVYVVCVARFMNVGLKSGQSVIAHLDPDLEPAARTLGAGEARIFLRVTLPQLMEAVSAGFAKAFSQSMTTLGAIIFLLLPGNKVVMQMIFQIMTGFALGPASVMALILSVSTLCVMGAFRLLLGGKETVNADHGH